MAEYQSTSKVFCSGTQELYESPLSKCWTGKLKSYDSNQIKSDIIRMNQIGISGAALLANHLVSGCDRLLMACGWRLLARNLAWHPNKLPHSSETVGWGKNVPAKSCIWLFDQDQRPSVESSKSNRMEAAGLPNLSNDYVMWLGNVTPKDSVALGIMFARKKMEVQTLEPFALAYGWCPWSIFNFIELIGIYLEIIFLNALPWIPPKFQNT